MTREELEAALRHAWGAPTVEAVSPDEFVVRLPNHRIPHDSFDVVVSRTERGWQVDDDGNAAFFMPADFERVAEVAQAAGSGFRPVANRLVAEMPDDHDLADSILREAIDMAAVTGMWHVLEASREARRGEAKARSATEEMAREMQSQIKNRVPRLGPLLRPDHVRYLSMHVRVPLVVGDPRGSKRPPWLISNFVDFTQSAQAVDAALKSASLTAEIAEKAGVKPRFIVTRGSDDQMTDLANLYDGRETTVVATTDPEPLLAAADELGERVLAGTR